ncbi:MAG: 23S rRNA pseudouridine(2604) synthase RluF [Lachnospiraceae bacterium]|nr:23S rRNA pseudouridine(2604) synthase RluF [Lachnospiraceae bacterium]
MGKITKNYFNQTNGGEEIRINKYLSDAGLCSRREADVLVAGGKVLIDGEVANVGSRVLPGQKVTVAGKEAVKEEHMVLIAFNKPRGVVCTSDRREPDNIVDYINYSSRIFPVGRLDKDSEGLILLTNNGEIVNKILRAGNGHEKEYIVEVNKPITMEFLKGMAAGVPILDTVTKPCRVEQVDKTVFRIVLTQGLNRQIRRMCEYFNYHVSSLKRVRVMNINLGRLKTGTYRNLTESELWGLNRLIGDSSNEPEKELGECTKDKHMPSKGIVLLKKREGKPKIKGGQRMKKKSGIPQAQAGERKPKGKDANKNAGKYRAKKEVFGKGHQKENSRPGNKIKSGTKNKDGAAWKKRRNA